MQETIELFGGPAIDREPAVELSPGLVIAGTYRVLELLGVGGMADVYEAEHERLGNRVALKVLRTGGRSDRPGIERFRHEARRVAALSSEHVVKVIDCGELPNGTPYLVMERLWGEDLRSLLARDGPLPVRRAVELAIGACRGLSAVHSAGLVHRDLKPANLFVVRRSEGSDWCKILDFGVAKALLSDATASGTLLGTVRYMAPEHLEDAASARATADIYAVGAILYEALTGNAPYAGETLQELMFNILHRELVPPSKLREIPPELEAVIMKALSRDKSKRYATADAMARALIPFGAVVLRESARVGAFDDTVEEHPSERLTIPARRRQVKSALSWVLAFVTMLVLVLVVQGAVSRNEARHEAKSGALSPGPTAVAPPPAAKPSEPTIAKVEPTAMIVAAAQAVTPPPSAPSPKRALKPRPQPAAQPPVAQEPPARSDRFDSRDPYAD